MNRSPLRAWLFMHPDFDADAGASGVRIAPTGGIALVEEDKAVRQAILLLLSTARGERVMRPDYGCDLGRLVFAPNDATTAGLAIHYVREAIQRWEPRVEILQLDAEPDSQDPSRLSIFLEYRNRATQRVREESFSFSLTAEDR